MNHRTRHADAAALAQYRKLAGQVRDGLTAAGLPAAIGVPGEPSPAGAVIHLDGLGDGLGGVWVEWVPGLELRDAARVEFEDFVQRRWPQPGIPPMVRHRGQVSQAMEQAVVAILCSAGFSVHTDVNDFAPFSAYVTGFDPEAVGSEPSGEQEA